MAEHKFEAIKNKLQFIGSCSLAPFKSPSKYYRERIVPEVEDNTTYVVQVSTLIAVFVFLNVFFSSRDVTDAFPPIVLWEKNIVEMPVFGELIVSFMLAVSLGLVGIMAALFEGSSFLFLSYKRFSMKNYLYYRYVMAFSMLPVLIVLAVIGGGVRVALEWIGFAIPIREYAFFMLFALYAFWLAPAWVVLRVELEGWLAPLPLLFGPLIYGSIVLSTIPQG